MYIIDVDVVIYIMMVTKNKRLPSENGELLLAHQQFAGWDCIRESQRLLDKLDRKIDGLDWLNYTKVPKRTYFKFSSSKIGVLRADLFRKQLASKQTYPGTTSFKDLNRLIKMIKIT